ncbi:MAG TPA: DNA repair protein RecO [Candidatus Eisenbergiella merdipullorum]|uniref:DNA repair protein RecO n=1 Tax=Candidatus Eisenbergiella merdipullorum TaxID=2838553 RepID=A0A9D2I7U2_9FIRM|nr:DNA repair protein RecO [Candidatus Eisenbergiella merdipullorum]
MQDLLTVTGLVLKAEPIGEYDKRVVILTKERGKLAVFARGARKQNSRFLAPTCPFSFGQFGLYAGRNSYTLADASISNYFETLRQDFEGAYYGMYFLEICDWCSRENNDEKELLKLLYQSLRALSASSIPRKLVRYIFEIRSIVVNGEFPGIPDEQKWQDSTVYAIHYMTTVPVEKLYTFTVSPLVLEELKKLADFYRKRFLNEPFHSLQILDTL